MKIKANIWAKALSQLGTQDPIENIRATKRFLQVVKKRGQSKLLPQILRIAKDILTRENLVISSARVLSADEQGMIVTFAKTKLNIDRIKTIINKIDQTIISGFKLNYGDLELDHSIAGRINKIKELP